MMKKLCGICKYWEFKGGQEGYMCNQGYCIDKLLKKMQDDTCDDWELHPVMMEE